MADWSNLQPTQWVTAENIIQAYTSGGFFMRNPVDSSQQFMTRGQAEYFVNINPIPGDSGAWVQRSEMVSLGPTPNLPNINAPTMYLLLQNPENFVTSSLNLRENFYFVSEIKNPVNGTSQTTNLVSTPSRWSLPLVPNQPQSIISGNPDRAPFVSGGSTYAAFAQNGNYNISYMAIDVKQVFANNPSWGKFDFSIAVSCPSESNIKPLRFVTEENVPINLNRYVLNTGNIIDRDSKSFRALCTISGTVYRGSGNVVSIYYEIIAS